MTYKYELIREFVDSPLIAQVDLQDDIITLYTEGVGESMLIIYLSELKELAEVLRNDLGIKI